MMPANGSGYGEMPAFLGKLGRNVRKQCRFAHVLALCVILPCLAMAQQDGSVPTFHSESSLVLVPTLVTTPQGKVVFNLQDKDFAVFDNGVEQAVQMDETFLSKPVSLVIAVQRGGRAPEVLGGGCPAPEKENIFTKKPGKCVSPLHGIALMLETFLNDPGSEMALVSFDSSVRLRQKFTPTVDALTKELETLPAGDGGSAILDAIQYSLGMLRQRPSDHRRVLVVVSEEVDRGSSHVTLEEAARQIASTNTEIYMVAMQNPDNGKQTLQMIAKLLGPMLMSAGARPMGSGGHGMGMGGMRGGGMGPGAGPLTGAATSAIGTTDAGRSAKNSGDSSFGDDGTTTMATGMSNLQAKLPLSRNGDQENIPQTIANLTGGEYVLFSDSHGLDDALGLLSNHAHNRYLLSYRMKNSDPGLHQITVRMREPMGVNISARSSYWLSAPADHPAAGSLVK
jgi:hypothetical protein